MNLSNRLIKNHNKFKAASNIIIGGADLSDLPNKEELISQQVQEAIEIAEKERQAILEQTNKEVKTFKEQAQKEAQEHRLTAYEEGFAIGKKEAMQAIETEFRSLISEICAILETIKKERDECLAEEEDNIYRMIILIAKQLLKKDLSLDRDLSIEFIKSAITKLESKAKIKIYIEPETAVKINNIKDKFKEEFSNIENLYIEEDSKLAPGDLIIESDSERLDYRLETQLEELAREILKQENQ